MEKDFGKIFSSFRGESGELIPLLQRIQDELGYLPADAMQRAAEFLNVPESKVFGVASFYSQFRFTPTGRNRISVCEGTACHVKGARDIIDEVSRAKGVGPGETSECMEYTLEGVACIGCCALAPCITVNDEVHGRLDKKAVQEIMKKI